MRSLFSLLSVVVLLFTNPLHADAVAEPPPLAIMTEDYPPLNYLESGELTGQATEVVRELIARVGNGERIEVVSWEEGYAALQERLNLGLFTTAMTEARKERFQWVGPIAISDTNLYALSGSGLAVKMLEDARQAAGIATVTGYYSEQVLQDAGFTNIESCADEAEAARKLFAGEVQLMASHEMAMHLVIGKLGASMDAIESAFTLSTDFGYLAFSRQTPAELVAHWQAGLDEMKKDGTFGRIHDRWLPHRPAAGIYQMMTEEYPPVTFMRDGEISGFATDIVRAIAARQDLSANFRLTSWKNAYKVARLNPNVVLFSTERTPGREDLFEWVGPIAHNRAILYGRKGSGIRVADLEGAKKVPAIATTTDWFTEQFLKEKGFRNLVGSADPLDNMRQLMEGEVGLAVFTDLTAPGIARSAGYRIEDLEPVLSITETDLYIAVSRGTSPDFVQAWQKGLEALKADGTVAEILQRYGVPAEAAGGR